MLQGPGTSKEPARVGSSAGLRTLSADLETGCLSVQLPSVLLELCNALAALGYSAVPVQMGKLRL